MKKLLLLIVPLFLYFGFSFASQIEYLYYVDNMFYSSASSSYSTTYDPWKAFDNSLSTNRGSALNSVSGAWLRIGLPQTIKLWKYDLCAAGVLAEAVQTATFEGSTDTLSWDILYFMTGLSWSSTSECKTFYLTTGVSQTGYNYYRLKSPSGTGGSAGGSIIATKEIRIYRIYDDYQQATGNYLPAMTSNSYNMVQTGVVAISGYISETVSGSYRLYSCPGPASPKTYHLANGATGTISSDDIRFSQDIRVGSSGTDLWFYYNPFRSILRRK